MTCQPTQPGPGGLRVFSWACVLSERPIDNGAGKRHNDERATDPPGVTMQDPTPGYAWGVAVGGSLAFVADDWDGLQIIAVSDPTH